MWDVILPYLKMIINGLVTSLAPIVAAIGIVVNNRKANERDYKNREKRLKTDILEDMYDMFQKARHEEIDFQIQIRHLQLNMVEEIIEFGTNSFLPRIRDLCSSNIFRAIDIEMYKQELRKILGIDISLKELLDLQQENYREILAQPQVLERITWILVDNYNNDKKGYLSATITMLQQAMDEKQFDWCLAKKRYDLSKSEKRMLIADMQRIIDQYNLQTDYTPISEADSALERKIATEIGKVLDIKTHSCR